MQHTFLDKPDFGTLLLTSTAAGESVVVESGAMLARDPQMEMKTAMRGGFLAAAKRKVLGGESLFMNTFTATGAGQRVWIAASSEGDIDAMQVESFGEGGLIIQSGGFLAADPSVMLDTKWGGLKGFISGAGLFFLKCTGAGRVFVSAYGAFHKVDLDGSAPYIVDTSHIVAFSSTLDFSITKLGGLKGLFLSGEGFVCRFTGAGSIWIQTRNPGALASFLHPFRKSGS